MTDGETKQMMAAMLEIKKCKDPEALKRIMELAREQYRYAAGKEANAMGWFVGQKVKQKASRSHRKPWDTEGTILKVNSVKLKVDFGVYGVYNCPKTIMESAM